MARVKFSLLKNNTNTVILKRNWLTTVNAKFNTDGAIQTETTVNYEHVQ